MFQDDYKNEMDKIAPDGFTKYKIKNKLSGETKKTSPKLYFGRAVAVALSVAVVFTAGAVIGRHTAPKIPVQNLALLKSAPDYDEIYSALAEFKPDFWDKVKDFANGGYKGTDDIAVEYEYATNTTAKPESSAVITDKIEGGMGDDSHSETTTQVEGVDEADIVKTDGKYIYILTHIDGTKIKIVEAGAKPRQLSSITIDEDVYSNNLYLSGDRLVVLCGVNDEKETRALIYDISDPEKPKKLEACSQSGYLNTSRLIGNKLYLISNYYINVNRIVKSDTESYIPYIKCGEYNGTVAPETVHFYDDCKNPEYTIISAFNIKDSSLISTQSVLGGTETVYASTDNIIVADGGYEKTQIARFKILDGKIELKASGELEGRLLNQFSIDEYKEHFRFVLTETVVTKEGEVVNNGSTVTKTVDETTTVNSLVILNGDLKETGKITDIAPDERVYSVRFMGDTAYFVTFRQVDPLFSVDVSNPKSPKIIGALKIPGFSNYLFPYGDGKLLGIGQNADELTGRTGSIKLSMFDISDPSNVAENDKTDIPAVYSEALYNHKAVLVDVGRNIIAFSGYGVYNAKSFFVYSYENGSFIKRLEAPMAIDANIGRGMYIGKTFYIVTDRKIDYYNIASFEKSGTLELK